MNTKSSGTKGKKDSERDGFTGWFIPVEVVRFFENDKITASEILLLVKIQSLAGLDKGCFASNKWFGEFIGMSSRSAGRAIAKLKSLGLVFETSFDGRIRKLETVWNKLGKDILKKNGVPVSRQSRQICPGRIDENVQADKTNLSTIEEGSIEEQENNTMSEQKSSDVACVNSGNLENDTSGKNGKYQPTKFDKIATKKLKRIIIDFRKRKYGTTRKIQIRGWADHFRKLRMVDDVSEKDIKKVLLWYKSNIGEYMIPEAFAGATFRSKFVRLEEAMDKSSKPKKEEWHDKEIEYFDKPSGKWYKRDILQLYLSKFQKRHGSLKKVNQEDLDALLLENGMDAGDLTASGVSHG